MKHLEARAALLRVKECDLRMDCLLQCDTSIDRVADRNDRALLQRTCGIQCYMPD